MGKIIQHYQLKGQLGQGDFATVYKAVNLLTKQEVAVKVFPASKFRQIPQLEQCIVNQINTLSTLQTCPYIVKYVDMLKTTKNFYFFYELCNGGNLDSLLQRQGPLPEKRVLVYFRQMVQAFKVLSKNNILHRDIKPDNILMHNDIIKIADIGFSKSLKSSNKPTTCLLRAPIYQAPEVIKGEIYTTKADIWSIGVVLYLLLFGHCPFEGKSVAKLIHKIEYEDLAFPQYPKISPTLQKLLKRILDKDYKNRIDWKEIFQYTITESGQIYLPGSSPQFLMEKHLPTKVYEEKDQPGVNESINYNQNIQQYAQKDRSNRLELFLRNHAKCVSLNQMILDMFRLMQPKCIYISYYLLEIIQKELKALAHSLCKKSLQATFQDAFKQQLKIVFDRQLQSVKGGLVLLRDAIEQQGDCKLNDLELRRSQILKTYLQGVNLGREEQLILILKIVDYLQDSVLLKKDAYEELSKGHLQKQLKQKFSKHNIERQFD